MNAREHYQAGDLQEAIAAATAEVKKNPAQTATRGFLCELLCFAGELERADKQLETLSIQNPETAIGVALFRQLIRGETARQQFFNEGRVPEFLHEPTPAMRSLLEASIRIRENDLPAASELAAQAEEQRPKVSGTLDGAAFDDFRDLDDLTASVFEVLTSTGKYYWVPVERVSSLIFHPPERPHDLIWRRAGMEVADGPEGDVYLPTLYPGTGRSGDDKLRLGRATDWQGDDGEPVRGLGLRTYLIGEDDRTILQLGEIEFGQ
ncbi:MAG: type VI secretion system accessory protein TagJ [Planctomycetaceae bacterium]